MNPHAEPWVQRVKRECLDWFIVFGEGHLRHVKTSILPITTVRAHTKGLAMCRWGRVRA